VKRTPVSRGVTSISDMPVTPKTAGGERGESEVSQVSRAYPDLSRARDRFDCCVRYMYGSQYARDTRDTRGKSPRRLSIFGVTGIFAAPVTPVTPYSPSRPNTHTVARSTSEGCCWVWENFKSVWVLVGSVAGQ